MKGKFESGQICLTSGIDERVNNVKGIRRFVYDSLQRHLSGDWGDCNPADAKENDFSVDKNLRIFSVYKNGADKIWIITEADRSTTTILLPEEY